MEVRHIEGSGRTSGGSDKRKAMDRWMDGWTDGRNVTAVWETDADAGLWVVILGSFRKKAWGSVATEEGSDDRRRLCVNCRVNSTVQYSTIQDRKGWRFRHSARVRNEGSLNLRVNGDHDNGMSMPNGNVMVI